MIAISVFSLQHLSGCSKLNLYSCLLRILNIFYTLFFLPSILKWWRHISFSLGTVSIHLSQSLRWATEHSGITYPLASPLQFFSLDNMARWEILWKHNSLLKNRLCIWERMFQIDQQKQDMVVWETWQILELQTVWYVCSGVWQEVRVGSWTRAR